MASAIVDLGTYRTADGDLIHCWYDSSGVLMAERDGIDGRRSVDPRIVTGAVKLSDDPFWPETEERFRGVLWKE